MKCFESKCQNEKKINYYFGIMILGYILHLGDLIFMERSQVNVQCQMMSHPSPSSKYLDHYEKSNKLHFMSTF